MRNWLGFVAMDMEINDGDLKLIYYPVLATRSGKISEI